MKIRNKGIVLFWLVATLLLAACDGRDSSTKSTPTTNVAPVANVVSTLSAFVGTKVSLDGSESSDSNGDPLSYTWNFLSKPAESAATLTQSNTPISTFFADVPGTYTAALIVNDGVVDSPSTIVTVTVVTENVKPVADAGTTQNVLTKALVTLNGSASSDANNDQLIYNWTLTSKPMNSAATLTNAASIRPTFIADFPGSYIASLVVNDGKLNSSAATVSINVNAIPVAVTKKAANVAPVANAGTVQNVLTNTLVTLYGNSSLDADNDTLTYNWSLISKPRASTATLSEATSITPTFMADVSGTYIASLVVNDGKLNSLPSTVTIESDIPVFAYSNNITESVITTYAVNKKTGILSKIATTMTDIHPIWMVIHPSQKYLYVTHMDASTVVAFSINNVTGGLTRISSIPVETTQFSSTVKPAFISVDPTGRFIYIANQVTNNTTGSFTTTVSTFSVDKSTGKLTPVSSVLPPLNNWSIDTHPNGKTAYIPSYNKNNITTYAIDQNTGALNPIGIEKTGFGPSSVAVEPGGRFAYTTNFKQNTISAFSINQSESTLLAGSLSNIESTISVDKGPVFLTVHQSGKFIYSGNHGAGNISAFNIDQTTGLLTPINTVVSSTTSFPGVSTLTIDPSGKFLYSMTPGSGIWIFSINQNTGELKEVSHQSGDSDSKIVFTKVMT